MRSRILVPCLLCLVVMGVLPARADTLRIATEGAYPPFNYVNDQGQLEGFDVDIAKALCRAMGRTCDIVAKDWDHIIDGLVAGEYEAIVASMAKTPERDALVDFTESYYRSRSSFVSHLDSDLATDSDLAGKRLCTAKGTIQADYLREHYKDSTIVLADDTPESFAMLARGEVDAVLSDSLNALEFLQSEQGADYDFSGEALPADDTSASAHIAVRSGDDAQRAAIDKALKDIRLSGEYERINRRYFPFSVY